MGSVGSVKAKSLRPIMKFSPLFATDGRTYLHARAQKREFVILDDTTVPGAPRFSLCEVIPERAGLEPAPVQARDDHAAVGELKTLIKAASRTRKTKVREQEAKARELLLARGIDPNSQIVDDDISDIGIAA